MEPSLWTFRNVLIFLGVGAGVALVGVGVKKLAGVVQAAA